MRFGLSARRISATLLIIAASALLPFAVSQAYVGQNPYIVTLDGPSGTVRCDAVVEITATVRSSETSVLVEGELIHWDFKTARSADDDVSPARTVTNHRGEVKVRVEFGPAEGQRVVRAAVIPEFPEFFNVSCAGGVPSVTAPPTRTPTASPTGTGNNTPRPTRSPNATPTDSVATPATPTDGTSAPPTSGTATDGPTVTLAPPATTAPQSTGAPVGASIPPVAVIPTVQPGGSQAPGGQVATPVANPSSAMPGQSGTPGGGGPGTGNPGTTPTGVDIALLAALAVLGTGLAVVGVVFVRRR